MVFALTLALLLPSLFFQAEPAGGQDTGELVLRVAMQDDIKTTNPLSAGDVWTWNVIGYLYERPLNVNPSTDELIPYIAVGSANTSTSLDQGEVDWSDCDIGTFGYTPRETWGQEVQGSDIGEAIIFYDFENVYWHDGTQMTIRDVMFSMHVAASIPEWSSSMNCLKDNGGGPGSNYSATSWLHIYKVWESDDHMQAALKFVLQEPFADFFRNTLSTFLLPYHIWGRKVSGQNVDGARIWCDADYDPNGTDAWNLDLAMAWENPNPVGSGPFKWDSWEPGQMIRITTWRDHFYKPGYKYGNYCLDSDGRSLARQPYIDAIVYKIYKTAEAAVLALNNNDIDYIAWSVPPTYVQELNNMPGVALQQSPETGFFYLAYNMRRQSFGYDESKSFPYAPEDDLGKPFRRAVAHCIDKERIVQRLLLNFGIPGNGPVYPPSEWYNDSLPTYDFDPEKAKRILADAGYKVNNGDSLLSGDEAIAAARPGNWWVNPDGSPIGSGPDGRIDILAPEANYDPFPTSPGLMIAYQLQDIGIYAESIAMDFGSIVDRIDQRNFDMYILGWRISSEPTDFLHAFFHSSQADYGQNYPGYQNASFDAIIDLARGTDNESVRLKAVKDAQASIVYDLPIDVLYHRMIIEAYRSDRFVGWIVGDSGSIFNRQSIYNIRAPSPYKVNAQFVSTPSAVVSNSTTQITVLARDQDGNPLEGVVVELNASSGTLDSAWGNTSSNGKFTTTFTAPYVDPDSPDAANGTRVFIQIKSARYWGEDGLEYDPAPSRQTVITVYPEGQSFLSVSLKADPDIIDPDVSADGSTFGFTNIEVTVTDENGDPVAGASVALAVSPAIPVISPAETTTDADGKAVFTLTSVDEPNNDGSLLEYLVTAYAVAPDPDIIPGENSVTVMVVDAEKIIIHIRPWWASLEPPMLVTIGAICLAAVAAGALAYRKKRS